MKLDFLVVGQGIAGTCVSYFLQRRGKSFKVIDNQHPRSASLVASGIINPITGRNFVKTWMADDLLPFADQFYTEMETQLQCNFYKKETICKVFSSVKDQNEWSIKALDPGYARFLKGDQIIRLNERQFHNPYGVFQIAGRRIDTNKMLSRYSAYLSEKDLILHSKFDFEQLQVMDEEVRYQSYTADKIIFCDGHLAKDNPFFDWLPFQLAKGEVLILRINEMELPFILNGKMILMPLDEKHLFYLGATKDWEDRSLEPTHEKCIVLENGLHQLIKMPYEVVRQEAGIRPTVKDRRPFIGCHPVHERVCIFNGLGTKGYSLAPFFAKEFTDHLLQGTPLNDAVNVARNYPSYAAS